MSNNHMVGKEDGQSERLPQHEYSTGRRKLLASLGIAGAAWAAGSLINGQAKYVNGQSLSITESVYGSPDGEDKGCCEVTTIASLRAVTAPDASIVYFVKDLGQEGLFYYDPTDGSAADNTGTVLVSGTGARFKRIYGEALMAAWFGAKGDGTTDDTAAIAAAISAASGKPVVFRSGSAYCITSTINVNQDVSLVANGCEPFKILPSSGFVAFSFHGSTVATTTLAATTQMNKEKITVTSSAGFAPGQIVMMQSSKLWYYDNRGTLCKGETHMVTHISGNDLVLRTQTWDSYDIAQETVTVTGYDPITVRIDNMTVEYPVNTNTGGIYLNATYRSHFNRVSVHNASVVGISTGRCYDALFTHCHVEGSNAVGLGYGIQDQHSFGTIIRESTFYNNRRGIDFSGVIPTRYGLVERCIVSGGGKASDGTDNFLQASGFGTHGPAEHIVFDGNFITHVTSGIFTRGGGITIRNNTFVGRMQQVILISFGTDVRILNNTYDSGFTSKASVGGSPSIYNYHPAYFVNIHYLTATNGCIEIIGNVATMVRVAFACVDASINHLVIMNNSCVWITNIPTNPVYFLDSGRNVTLTKASFIDNREELKNGQYTFAKASIGFDLGKLDAERFPIRDAARLVTWSGTASLANAQVNLILAKVGQTVRLIGKVSFDVTGSGDAKVKLTGLPQPVSGRIFAAYVDRDLNQGITGMLSTATDLLISRDMAAYDSSFPIGTGYEIPIQFEYLTT
ncbi:glycosyl hydrolase family 28-related protein [Paenibacillus hodogayensis]|uniref:Glycosyl hydrolase family 28-related protein n=1 Tax=Paenibacillus hodogayensis TaxID=279208 RepID=A0ABV5W276_9BACL